jgi:hypothetical protein
VKGPVFGEEYRTSRAEGGEIRSGSLLGNFSISEILTWSRPETGCVPQRPVRICKTRKPRALPHRQVGRLLAMRGTNGTGTSSPGPRSSPRDFYISGIIEPHRARARPQ